jgi:hypothetical protein
VEEPVEDQVEQAKRHVHDHARWLTNRITAGEELRPTFGTPQGTRFPDAIKMFEEAQTDGLTDIVDVRVVQSVAAGDVADEWQVPFHEPAAGSAVAVAGRCEQFAGFGR